MFRSLAMTRHTILTGPPGVGKSTLVRSVLQRLAQKYGDLGGIATGFYTEEIRGSVGRLGFDVVTLGGRRGPLARVGSAPRGTPTVGRYVVDLASFESLALPELEVKEGVKLLVIDEIGKMEFFSKKFVDTVEELLDAGPAILGVVPLRSRIPLVTMIKGRKDVNLVTLSKENRNDAVPIVTEEVARQIDLVETGNPEGDGGPSQ